MIETKGFTDLVRDQVAAIQAAAAGLVDFTVGSVLRAVVEAIAFVALWLQGLVLALLSTTRAATSTGADLDSFMADFALTRSSATLARGSLTFARFSTSTQAQVQAGARVETGDGSVQYEVLADAGNGAWSEALQAYLINVGDASVTVSARALTAGQAGNAAPGAVSTIVQSIPGVDTVTNASAFEGGADAESDDAFRVRFREYLASLSKATPDAIRFAIENVQAGLSYALVENEDYAGTTHYGYFYAVVDDGTGDPPGELLDAVERAIELVRPISVTFGVYAPTILTVNVALNVAVAAGYVGSQVRDAVEAAIAAHIEGLGIGGALRLTRIAQLAYDASPGVANVTAVTLNAGTSDIAPTPKEIIHAGTIAAS